jgi:hypothetical protein
LPAAAAAAANQHNWPNMNPIRSCRIMRRSLFKPMKNVCLITCHHFCFFFIESIFFNQTGATLAIK